MYKRSVFNITIINNGEPSTKEVSGMIWGNYGFYKEDGEYHPTYIPNGYALPIPSSVFNYCKTSKKAKEVIMVYKDFFGGNIPIATRHGDEFRVSAYVTDAKRSHGQGALVTVNGREI